MDRVYHARHLDTIAHLVQLHLHNIHALTRLVPNMLQPYVQVLVIHGWCQSRHAQRDNTQVLLRTPIMSPPPAELRPFTYKDLLSQVIIKRSDSQVERVLRATLQYRPR